MKKTMFAICGFLLGAYSTLICAADPVFDAKTNVLNLPSVTVSTSVGNTVYYNVNILLNPSGFGNGWLPLPNVPTCMTDSPPTCPGTQPQLISFTISGPDTIPEGTSATYYAQSEWMWYFFDAQGQIHWEIKKGESGLPIYLAGTAYAVIDKATVTAKQVTKDTPITLTVYDSFQGVPATATKTVTIINVPTAAPVSGIIQNFTDLYPGSIFKVLQADGATTSWILSATSTCILPQTTATGTTANVTIYTTTAGTIMKVDGDPISCPIEPL